MSVLHHVYDIPSDDDLESIIGAATPHFSLQLRDRIQDYIDSVGPDHPRVPFLRTQIERMEYLAFHGQDTAPGSADLRPPIR